MATLHTADCGVEGARPGAPWSRRRGGGRPCTTRCWAGGRGGCTTTAALGRRRRAGRAALLRAILRRWEPAQRLGTWGRPRRTRRPPPVGWGLLLAFRGPPSTPGGAESAQPASHACWPRGPNDCRRPCGAAMRASLADGPEEAWARQRVNCTTWGFAARCAGTQARAGPPPLRRRSLPWFLAAGPGWTRAGPLSGGGSACGAARRARDWQGRGRNGGAALCGGGGMAPCLPVGWGMPGPNGMPRVRDPGTTGHRRSAPGRRRRRPSAAAPFRASLTLRPALLRRHVHLCHAGAPAAPQGAWHAGRRTPAASSRGGGGVSSGQGKVLVGEGKTQRRRRARPPSQARWRGKRATGVRAAAQTAAAAAGATFA